MLTEFGTGVEMENFILHFKTIKIKLISSFTCQNLNYS